MTKETKTLLINLLNQTIAKYEDDYRQKPTFSIYALIEDLKIALKEVENL